MDRALNALRRKLEAAELEHLRRHVAELQDRCEAAEERAARADEWAENWRDQLWQLQEDLAEELEASGMTKDGAIGVIDTAKTDTAQQLLDLLRVARSMVSLSLPEGRNPSLGTSNWLVDIDAAIAKSEGATS